MSPRTDITHSFFTDEDGLVPTIHIHRRDSVSVHLHYLDLLLKPKRYQYYCNSDGCIDSRQLT